MIWTKFVAVVSIVTVFPVGIAFYTIIRITGDKKIPIKYETLSFSLLVREKEIDCCCCCFFSLAPNRSISVFFNLKIQNNYRLDGFIDVIYYNTINTHWRYDQMLNIRNGIMMEIKKKLYRESASSQIERHSFNCHCIFYSINFHFGIDTVVTINKN